MFTFGFNIKPKKAGSVSYDADAEAFFTAASITDTTQKSAVNQLVLDLKSYNIWTKMIALYPICGGSASSHAVNLKTPGTYNLTFATGMTHSSTGMVSNGSTGYADTAFNQVSQSMNLNSTHLSYYSRTSTLGTYFEIGCVQLAPDQFFSLTPNYSGTLYYSNNQTVSPTTTGQTPTGLFLTSRTASNLTTVYKNGASLATNTSAPSSGVNRNVWICARNSNGIKLYSIRECAFASIGNGLDATEAANYYTAVQAYQTTLSRNV